MISGEIELSLRIGYALLEYTIRGADIEKYGSQLKDIFIAMRCHGILPEMYPVSDEYLSDTMRVMVRHQGDSSLSKYIKDRKDEIIGLNIKCGKEEWNKINFSWEKQSAIWELMCFLRAINFLYPRRNWLNVAKEGGLFDEGSPFYKFMSDAEYYSIIELLYQKCDKVAKDYYF